MEMLTNLIVVIVLQCIHVSNHHIVYLKHTYTNNNSMKLEGGKLQRENIYIYIYTYI